MLFHRGDVAGAQRLAQQTVKNDPQFVEGWLFLSKLALAVNQAGAASRLAASAAKIKPDDVRVRAHQAYALAASMKRNDALAILSGLEGREGADPETWSDVGNAYHICGDLPRAQHAFERAHELAPENPSFQYNLATSCKFAGNFERAESLADEVIAKAPEDWAVYEFRSGLRKQTQDRNHIAELTSLLKRGVREPGGEMKVAYALAKEHEDLGELPAAFEHYKRAADTRRRGMNYSVAGDVDAMAMIRRTYSKEFFDVANGIDDAGPIFIVGLPRTGTTLLDRILSGHSQVFSAGELQDFGNSLVQQVLRASKDAQHSKLSMIQAARDIDHTELGRTYLANTQSRAGDTKHFIDKLPLNYLYLGSIAKALPNATLIHMDRHPLDTAFAIYKTLFSDAYPFSYDLEDLGHYYVAYRRLMKHWHSVLGDRLLRVSYEDLVEDTEGEAKRVIEHVSLTWEPQCLDFHRNAQPTNTASAVQVREKVYSSSVGKWRKLERQLASFRAIVDDAGDI